MLFTSCITNPTFCFKFSSVFIVRSNLLKFLFCSWDNDGKIKRADQAAADVQYLFSSSLFFSPLAQINPYLRPAKTGSFTFSLLGLNSPSPIISYLSPALSHYSVLVPSQSTVYLIPGARSTEAFWHTLCTRTGAIRAYRSPSSNSGNDNKLWPGLSSPQLAADAYSGGVYSPRNQLIYFVPWQQASKASWHYVNTLTGLVVTYRPSTASAGNIASTKAYSGGVYAPRNNRIYLVPFNQATQPVWHYIECATGRVVAYAAPPAASLSLGAYRGGVYCPYSMRVYFVPHAQASRTHWHYVDTESARVYAYRHKQNVSAMAQGGAYHGGVYSPPRRRIYFVPYAQATRAEWHFVECETGRIVAYKHNVRTGSGEIVDRAYNGGVYVSAQERIYLIPSEQAQSVLWHYIDCKTGTVVAYCHLSFFVFHPFQGGVYVPERKSLMFISYQANRYQVVAMNVTNRNTLSIFTNLDVMGEKSIINRWQEYLAR